MRLKRVSYVFAFVLALIFIITNVYASSYLNDANKPIITASDPNDGEAINIAPRMDFAQIAKKKVDIVVAVGHTNNNNVDVIKNSVNNIIKPALAEQNLDVTIKAFDVSKIRFYNKYTVVSGVKGNLVQAGITALDGTYPDSGAQGGYWYEKFAYYKYNRSKIIPAHYEDAIGSTSTSGYSNATGYPGFTFNSKTGIYTLSGSLGSTSNGTRYCIGSYSYSDYNSTSGNTMVNAGCNGSSSWQQNHYAKYIPDTPGDYLDTVTVPNGTYPDNGVKDGFYYRKLNAYDKYSVSGTNYAYKAVGTYESGYNYGEGYTGFTFDNKTGIFTLTGTKKVIDGSKDPSGTVYIIEDDNHYDTGNMSGTKILQKYVMHGTFVPGVYGTGPLRFETYYDSYLDPNLKGTYLDTVYEVPGVYPDDAKHTDGYWYTNLNSAGNFLNEAALAGNWRSDSERYLFYADDSTMSFIGDSGYARVCAETLLKDNINLVGLGSPASVPQFKMFSKYTNVNSQVFYNKYTSAQDGNYDDAPWVYDSLVAGYNVQGDSWKTSYTFNSATNQYAESGSSTKPPMYYSSSLPIYYTVNGTKTQVAKYVPGTDGGNYWALYSKYIKNAVQNSIKYKGVNPLERFTLTEDGTHVDGTLNSDGYYYERVQYNQYTTDASPSLDNALKSAAEFITAKNTTDGGEGLGYLLMDEEFDLSAYYSDYENDPQNASRWKFTHIDPNYFENSNGVFAQSGQYIDSLKSLHNVGKYEILAEAQDNPKNDVRFDNYKKWSGDNASKLIAYVHRRPVAQFTVEFTGKDASNNLFTAITDTSYDTDHLSLTSKGIQETSWSYKESSAGTWTTGKLPTTITKGRTYQVMLKVKDIEGCWSYPCVQTVDTNLVNFPPYVDANPKCKDWTNQTVNVTVTAIDIDGTITSLGTVINNTIDEPTTGWTTSAAITQVKSIASSGIWYVHAKATDDGGLSEQKTFGVYKVDKINPSGSFSPNSQSTGVSSFSTVFTPSDTGGSNVKQWRYRISTNNGSSYGAWSGYIAGNTSSTINLTTEGINVIQAEVTDNAGNIGTVTSGNYNIISLSITGLTITGSWNHWNKASYTDLSGHFCPYNPHRFLSLEKVKVTVNTTGYADKVVFRLSPELESMYFTDSSGNQYDYYDFFGKRLSFPADSTFILDSSKNTNSFTWEYCLPLAPSTMSWANLSLRSPYSLTATVYKGLISKSQTISNIQITSNVYDLSLTQTKH